MNVCNIFLEHQHSFSTEAIDSIKRRRYSDLLCDNTSIQMVRNDPFLSNSSVISCNAKNHRNDLDFQQINLLLPASALMPSGNIYLLDSIKTPSIKYRILWNLITNDLYNFFTASGFKVCSESESKICSDDSTALSYQTSTTKEDCESTCNGNENCNFISFYEDLGSCLLLITCNGLNSVNYNANTSVLAKNQCPGNYKSNF